MIDGAGRLSLASLMSARSAPVVYQVWVKLNPWLDRFTAWSVTRLTSLANSWLLAVSA